MRFAAIASLARSMPRPSAVRPLLPGTKPARMVRKADDSPPETTQQWSFQCETCRSPRIGAKGRRGIQSVDAGWFTIEQRTPDLSGRCVAHR